MFKPCDSDFVRIQTFSQLDPGALLILDIYRFCRPEIRKKPHIIEHSHFRRTKRSVLFLQM